MTFHRRPPGLHFTGSQLAPCVRIGWALVVTPPVARNARTGQENNTSRVLTPGPGLEWRFPRTYQVLQHFEELLHVEGDFVGGSGHDDQPGGDGGQADEGQLSVRVLGGGGPGNGQITVSFRKPKR